MHVGAFHPKTCQFIPANKRRRVHQSHQKDCFRERITHQPHSSSTSSIYTIASRAAFGKKCKDQEKFISFVKEATTIAGGFDIGDLFPSSKWLQLVSRLRPKLERLQRQTDQILENIINDHKEAMSKAKEGYGGSDEDLVDVLLKFEDGNATSQDICLTKNNIKAIILVWIVLL